jgi:hypothetical protein
MYQQRLEETEAPASTLQYDTCLASVLVPHVGVPPGARFRVWGLGFRV